MAPYIKPFKTAAASIKHPPLHTNFVMTLVKQKTNYAGSA
jgi:hypothetical protein